MDATRGTSPSKHDAPEQLIDVFKAAALSVTKLYKTSAAAQAKARSDGYQDCLDDLLAFLDSKNIGLGDGEGWQIRRWATERLEGRDAQAGESDDEIDKAETASSPEIHRAATSAQPTPQQSESAMPTDPTPAPAAPQSDDMSPMVEEPQIVVPSQDQFTFQSSHPFPQESYLNLENLDLSDSRTRDNTTQAASLGQHPRPRNNRAAQRQRTSNQLGRGAGQKRKINFAEIFDLGSIGYSKDMFGNGGGKRGRHA